MKINYYVNYRLLHSFYSFAMTVKNIVIANIFNNSVTMQQSDIKKLNFFVLY